MARFVIEQRAPGAAGDVTVPWDPVAEVEAPSAAAAIQSFCRGQQWFGVQFNHDLATVPGVGHFRAMPGAEAARHAFVVQRQAEMGPRDRHIEWHDVDVVDAADERAAIRLYCERQQWVNVAISGTWFRPQGMGHYRVVPAGMADRMRITPAP